MRILFVDPGKDTGWFALDTRSETWTGGELPHFEFLTWAEQTVYHQPWPERVVCEGFRITAETAQKVRARDPLWSVEQIGALRFWCERNGIPFETPPSAWKEFGTDDRLKRLDWYKPMLGVKGEEGHRRDAARHAAKWCTDHNVIDLEKLL
jgi:hypothetical protein